MVIRKKLWQKMLQYLHNLGGTFLFAGAAGGTFIVVNKRNTVVKHNTLFGALLYADPALDAAQAAGFSDRGAYWIAV